MQLKSIITQLLLSFLFSFSAWAQNQGKPQSFEEFFDSDKMTIEKGDFNVYEGDGRYFIEIDKNEIGQKLFLSSQITKGYSSVISSESGVYYFKEGRNNSLDLYQNKSNTFPHDTVDFCMVEAIKSSGLIPAYKSYPIIAYGENNKSFIIELTQDLSALNGPFSLGQPGPLTSPDPMRSGVESYECIKEGVVFKAYATQSSFGQGQGGKDENFIASYQFQMLIQKMPDHQHELKKNSEAYGFNTVQHIVYNTKNYRADKVNYIKRWNLTTSAKNKRLQAKGVAVTPDTPIKVWIDPVTPAPFVESLKDALKQWEGAFELAGWKNVFQYVSDEALVYHKINFFWGNAYEQPNKFTVDDPVSGEILAARVNFMDESAKSAMINYALLCGNVDKAVLHNIDELKTRQRILTSQMAGVIGELLGVKPNYPAVTAFSPKQLRNNEWLKKWGPTASVVGASMPNYLVQSVDGVQFENLIPKVSVYDHEAIAYLYGQRTRSPSIKAAYYAETTKTDPYAQASFLSNDLLEASELGLRNLQAVYAQLPTVLNNQKSLGNVSDEMNKLTAQTFSLYQFFVNQEAILIGGQSRRTIIRGENEVPVQYVSKEKQFKVLDKLEQNVFVGAPKWLNNPTLMKYCPVNMDRFSVSMSRNILQNLLKSEVLLSLIQAEDELGDTAFTCTDLFAFLDRVIFLDYAPNVVPTQVQMSTQVELVNAISKAANDNNITGGVNDLSNVIQLYLLHVRDNVEALMNNEQARPAVKNNCKLMLLRLKRNYFNKTV